MSLLLQFWPYIAAAAAALLSVLGLYATGRAAGKNAQLVKEAKAREQNLDKIKRAAAARPAGGVSDDPNNRDV